MTTPYTGVPGNVSLGSAAQANVPVDSDPNAAATWTVGMQKTLDYVEALRLGLAVSAFSEGFESATFPPVATREWATPSPRFGTDSTWVRTTTNPIAGTASASAPVPQTLSTNSSLGLTVFVSTPSRLSVLWAVNCNANTSDHLDIIIDGTTVAQFSSQVSNTLVGGIYYSDLLAVGQHTIDFRFIRGASASVGAEECKIDTVQIIPEEIWRNDPTRLYVFDEGFGQPVNTTAMATADVYQAAWEFVSSANLGSTVFGTPVANGAMGVVGSRTAATAAGDYVRAHLQFQAGAALVNPATQQMFVESRFAVVTRTANTISSVGPMTGEASGTDTNYVHWAFDGSLGATSTWRWRADANGSVTTVDSGIASADSTWFRFGVMLGTARGVSTAVFTKDGKALPGAANIPPLLPFTAPVSIRAFSGGFRNRSVTAAAAIQAGNVDWMRVLMLRP